MLRLAVGLLVAALGCGIFAYWGLFTTAGANAFDEMSGMIPFMVGLSCAPLLAASAAAWWVGRSRKRRENVSK